MKNLKIISWCLYDFANSSFSTIIVTFTFSLYFKEVLVGGSHGIFYWGLLQAISYFSAALISIFIGPYADRNERHKRYFIFFSLLSIVSTGFLFFINKGQAWLGALLYGLGFIGFSIANIFYNGFLLSISDRQNFGRTSGAGWGIGYLGGLACLVLFRPWMNDENIKTTFLLTSAFFLIFSIPSFLSMKQERTSQEMAPKKISLASPLINIFRQPNLRRFFFAFFFYNEAIATLIAYASLFCRDIYHMSVEKISTYLIMLQVTALIGALVSGFWVDRVGSKKTILFFLLTWIFSIVGIYATRSDTWFWTLSLFMGLGLGAIQSASRTFMALSISIHEQGEMMSLFSIATKISSFLGPLLFGWIMYGAKNPKNAVWVLILFLSLGLFLLIRTKDPKFSCIEESNIG